MRIVSCSDNETKTIQTLLQTKWRFIYIIDTNRVKMLHKHYQNVKMPLGFLLTNNKKNMLLYKNYLYYHWSNNYYRCITCRSTVSTTGETTQDEVKRTSAYQHDHLEYSRAEIECKRAITRLKQRAEDETSESYKVANDRERAYLRSIGLTTEDLAAHLESVTDMRSTLDKR